MRKHKRLYIQEILQLLELLESILINEVWIRGHLEIPEISDSIAFFQLYVVNLGNFWQRIIFWTI